MLVSPKHKKLVFNVRDPNKITAVIPTAKTLNYKGRTLVAVPHSLDEVRVLRNLGFDVPAPIEHYYDWPGRYQPYAHQKITASFLTSNPRAFCLNGMGCIAGDETVRVSRKGKSYETSLRELFGKFTSMPDRDSWRARSLMGDRFGMNKLLDVLYKGDKPTLRITLADGKTFRCTPDHRIARPDGSWTEAGDLRVGDDLVTNGTKTYACPSCGQPRERKTPPRTPSQVCLPCKHTAHSAKLTGEGNPAWSGGAFKDKDGYVRAWAPNHHRADNNGRVYEHILVAEAAFGVAVTRDVHVHHINGVRDDNRPENLEVLAPGDHHRAHDPVLKLHGSVSAKGGVVVVLPSSSVIVSIEDGGVVDVYDLCMEAPHHNFVVNGVVVHNSGKTVSVLWAFDSLKKMGLVKRMLVVGPLSSLERAWADEVFRHFPHLTCTVLHGTRERRHKLLAADFDIYIINHDGVKNKETTTLLATREGLDIVVVDEVDTARNASTDMWKSLNVIINGSKKGDIPPKHWAWGLTGTPVPNYPTDAWAQCKLIVPGSVPTYFGAFRDRVMRQLTKFKWVARDDAMNQVFQVMQPAVRFAREDCIDLPPTTYQTVQVALTDEQRKAFDEMVRRLKTEHDGGKITAMNEAGKLNKLIQICLGTAYGEDGHITIPATPRVDLVRDLIRRAEGKVLVFAPLTGALLSLAESLREEFTVETVYGDISKTQRDRIFHDFQNSRDPRVIVANPRTMSHSLTLTEANTIIWFGPTHSNGTYQQANARVTRPGQRRNTLIVNIEATPIERRIYQVLQDRGAMQGLLLDLVRGA